MKSLEEGETAKGMEHLYDVAIVGGGIAGYTAALTSKNLLLDYVWLGGEPFGEKLRLAEKVTNFPSLSGSGRDFQKALFAQMGSENVVFTQARADGVYRTGADFRITCGDEFFSARAVILATGVETRGKIAGEKEFLGRGVSYCAVCDAALYRRKKVAAVLSSAEFEREARYLANFAETVYTVCLYPGPQIGGENLVPVEGVPVAVEGEGRVERLVFRDKSLAVSGVFFLRDSAPPEALAFGVKTEGAHVAVDRSLATNLPGLFAAGDVTGRPYQYAKAAGEGCVAAHSVRDYLKRLKN